MEGGRQRWTAEPEADREQALEAFHGLLMAAIRMGNESGIRTSTPELERIGTKEQLADWFRKKRNRELWLLAGQSTAPRRRMIPVWRTERHRYRGTFAAEPLGGKYSRVNRPSGESG